MIDYLKYTIKLIKTLLGSSLSNVHFTVFILILYLCTCVYLNFGLLKKCNKHDHNILDKRLNPSMYNMTY